MVESSYVAARRLLDRVEDDYVSCQRRVPRELQGVHQRSLCISIMLAMMAGHGQARPRSRARRWKLQLRREAEIRLCSRRYGVARGGRGRRGGGLVVWSGGERVAARVGVAGCGGGPEVHQNPWPT
jgi:hypothetical protein